MLSRWVVRIVEQFVQRVVKTLTGASEDLREIRQARLPALSFGGVADMKDHAGCDGGGGVLPVALLRAVLASANNHVSDVLRIRNIAGGADPEFGERIETGAIPFLDRRELEAELRREPSMRRKPRG